MARKPRSTSQKVAKLEKQIQNLKTRMKDKTAKRGYKLQKVQNKRQWLDTKAQNKYKKRQQKIEKIKVLGERQGRTTRATIRAGVAAQGITETGMTVRHSITAKTQADELINAGAVNVNEDENSNANKSYEDVYGGLGK